jgi:hypothetical protein
LSSCSHEALRDGFAYTGELLLAVVREGGGDALTGPDHNALGAILNLGVACWALTLYDAGVTENRYLAPDLIVVDATTVDPE